jgi:hypothetical protein
LFTRGWKMVASAEREVLLRVIPASGAHYRLR